MRFGQKEKTANVIEAAPVADSRALASAWLVTSIILVLKERRWCRLRASAVYAPPDSSKTVRQDLHDWWGLAWSLLLSGAIRLFVRSVPRATWLSGCVIAVLASLHAALLGASSSYAKFGTYPLASVVGDFIAAPTVFLAYTKVGVAISDSIWTAAAIVALVGGALGLTRILRVAASLSAGFVLVDLCLLLPCCGPSCRFRPTPWTDNTRSSSVSTGCRSESMSLTRFDVPPRIVSRLPRRTCLEPLGIPLVLSPRPNARHVLLVLAECLRADRLPVYGYHRDTTPFITSDIQNWIAFDNAYSHGSRTTDSFPVIFNSRYFAGIDRRNDYAT